MARRPLRPSRPLAGSVVALLLCGAAVSGLQAPASADDIAQRIRAGQAELDRLDSQAEAASERYDAAQIALGAATERATVAHAALAHEDAAVAALRARAGAYASQVYMSGTGGLDLLASTAGPADLLDRLGRLDRIATTQSDVLAALATARHREAETATRAHRAELDAAAVLSGLKADKTQVQQAATRSQAVLRDLQAQQVRMIQAAKDEVERAAARARAASLAAQAAATARALAAFVKQPLQVVPVRALAVVAPRAAAAAPTTVRVTPRSPRKIAAVPHYSGDAAQVAVQTALAQAGKPYVWGAAGPDTFDCSGLTLFSYAAAGIALPHFTGAQWNVGRHVAESELQPGDLIFFHSDLHHMAMYIGGGQLIHAPHSGDVVRVAALSGWFQDNYAGAVRVVG